MQSYQRFQHVGHTAFNTSGTNAATLVSKGCGGYTPPQPLTAHTAAYTAKHGASLLCVRLTVG